MAEDKASHTDEQTKPRRLRPWRPTRRQVLWAVGTLLALVTIALLVVNRDAVKWEDLLSRERIEQVSLFIGMAVALTTLIVLLAIGGASLGWTGFADKTLWEWLQLLGALAIPLVLAIAGFWFTTQQEARQQSIETQRAEAERELAEQRAQDEALQAYLDQMGSLLLEKDLRDSDKDSEARTLARARTVTVIQRLDADGNANVIRFLDEARLTNVHSKPRLLGGVDLQGAQLAGIDLSYTYLEDTNLSYANLRGADLSYSKLLDANLRHANLRGADLTFANLAAANFSDANLRGATLSYAGLLGATLYDANLSHANLRFAEPSAAALNGANLKGANLKGANLFDTYLNGANLEDVNLSNANLNDAQGATGKQLEDMAKTLEGATMPDGSKHP